MKDSRLTLAVEAGLFTPPDAGGILVFRPRAGEDLSALPRGRVRVVQGFRPDHDAFAAAGYAVGPGPEEAAAAVVFLPRAKAEARALLCEAVAHVPVGAPVVVDGQKTDGIDSLLREIRGLAEPGEPISKAHGKIFVFPAPPGGRFEAWRAAPHRVDGFLTAPGVFSADGIDPGSERLAAALPASLSGRAADLGAGWGYLAARLLERPGIRELHLVEAEAAALDCARANIDDPRARFHWADVARFRPEAALDLVISNPPFHTGRAADPALGAAFIRAAAGMLSPGGSFWMVANRHLPYEAPLAAAFREVEEMTGDGAFKILRAARPHQPFRR